MNNNYNDKFAENMNNVIELQEHVDKLSNQLKFYQHNSRSDTNASLPQHTSQNSVDFNGFKSA